jgi:putative transposase
MNSIYAAIDITKQGFHQWMDHYMQVMEEEQQLLPVIRQIRTDHPRMSAKTMYNLIKPKSMGRDKFMNFCFQNGYKIAVNRAYHKTTNSLGVTRFDNLIAGKELTTINQVWVSDITFYRIMDRFYYLTFVMDLYSRVITGYSTSVDMLTEHTTIPALEMSLSARQPASGLIFHSDGGGQYYSKKFMAITGKNKIHNSMCESVYENAHAERVNGTIKNDYLYSYNPKTLDELKRMLKKAVKMYNQFKPHQALFGLSPCNFELSIIK